MLEQPAYRSIADKVLFEPAARLNDDGELIAQLASPELEEMRRHIGVFKIGGRSAYRKYLDARRRDPLSSYWDDFVKKAGLDPDRVKTAARSEETQAALKTASQTATDLGLQGDLYILVENRELADVRDKDDFIRLLNAVYGKN
ncbi:MAG: hypothetical protein M5R36_01530 [Deltaproteobacteria bacterium]|nr:hypothetical protein [Deltaproteobacteria bacterium]